MGFGVNKRKMKCKTDRGSSLFYLFVFFMFVLAPTSSNGIMPGVSQIIGNWIVLSISILVCMSFFSKAHKDQFMIVLFIIGFMVIITVISSLYSPIGRFSLARLAPILCFLMMTLVSIKTIVPIKLVKYTVHFFIGIFIIWNSLIIFGDSMIKEFTISNYSQLYEEATSNMFLKNRPVMSFGIYTFASYFYFIFFLICRSLLKLTNNRIYLVYMFFILVANILLTSNTAFVFSFIMSSFLFFSFKRKASKIAFILVCTAGMLFILSDLALVEYYLESFYSEANGFRGRYTETGSLNRNWDYIQNNFFIGFNIIENLNYTDSGYIVYYLMGGPVLLLTMYYCFYRFTKNNFSSDYLLFLIPTLIFEFALPVMIYYKFIYASLFFALTFKSINFHKVLEKQQQ